MTAIVVPDKPRFKELLRNVSYDTDVTVKSFPIQIKWEFKINDEVSKYRRKLLEILGR